jgi:cellulose synthase/poly-beta-1,6-N-acetylglucosamine synthase-like glycosyltransferase
MKASMESETTLQLEEMKKTMGQMELTILEQNLQMKQIMTQQSEQMDFVVKTLTWRDEDEELPGPVPIDVGSYEIHFGNTTWMLTGVSSCEPDPDFVYFPGLAWSATDPTSPPNDNIISAIIPCYNEEGVDLERTIRGLSRQIMPEGWRIEVVIVMDGVGAMTDSMSKYLAQIFGIHFKPEDRDQDPFLNPYDPFLVLPQAETIIVQPLNKEAAYTRLPVIQGTVGGFSLVVKKENRRKANSQQWWLGPHSTAMGCKYALATDCGTYFERKTVKRLIERLDDDICTHAVTGTQQTMPSDIQGDGNFEYCHHPFNFVLRMLQRFEFEVCIMCSVDSFTFQVLACTFLIFLWPMHSLLRFLRWRMPAS